MTEYVFTSKSFEGFISLGYNDKGLLVKFLYEAQMDNNQLNYFYQHGNFPVHISMLDKLRTQTSKIEVAEAVTFDRFWEEYDYKKGKLKAQTEWSKLSEGDKAKAIYKIKAFKYYSHSKNIELPYPERYLKHRRFDDE